MSRWTRTLSRRRIAALGLQSALFETHQAIHPPERNLQRFANETDFRERPRVLCVCLNSRCLCLPSVQQFVRQHPSQAPQAQQSADDQTNWISDIRAATARSPTHPVMATTDSPEIPIIIVLGPPGSGKGTICAQLAEDFNLHHLSIGDWLRKQAVPPIAGVPNHINEYVFNGTEIPFEVMEAEYGREEDAPAPLILYNCSKRNCSTPEFMKCKIMPALREEIDRLAASPCSTEWWCWRDRPKAVLLDNLTSTLAHAEAAMETFGPEFPTLAITVHCSDETAEARFLARGRGGDDVARFRRRIARYRQGNGEVRSFFRERGTDIVEVSAEGQPEDVYRGLLQTLARSKVWGAITGGKKRESLEPDVEQTFEGAVLRPGIQV